jgi:ADP-ribose pyrophosphatase
MREEKLYSRKIFKGKILSLFKDSVELEDGRNTTREIVIHKDAACVLPVRDDNVILIKQFRYPLSNNIIEIPAGIIEGDEDPYSAARRELKEETGYVSSNMKKIISFHSSPGFTNEKLHLFIARDIIQGEQELDTDEDIELLEISLNKSIDMIIKGDIVDAKTIIALYTYRYMLETNRI